MSALLQGLLGISDLNRFYDDILEGLPRDQAWHLSVCRVGVLQFPQAARNRANEPRSYRWA